MNLDRKRSEVGGKSEPNKAVTAAVENCGTAISEGVDTIKKKAEDVFSQVAGSTGQLKETLSNAADRTSEVISKGYEASSEYIRQVNDGMIRFVRQRPFTAIGCTLAFGVVIGRLLMGRREVRS